MADRHSIIKNATKEIAWQRGKAVTFLAKWNYNAAGSSSHIHQSLWSLDGRQAKFLDKDAKHGMSELMRMYVAGLLAHASEITYFLAPYINSYKRFVAGTFAPTKAIWSKDNRTAGYRLCGEGTKGIRIECRVGGSDLNPYLAMAALLWGLLRPKSADVRALGAFAASRLNGESRIAAFSIVGWDSHATQEAVLGRALDRLAAAILALRDGLGPNWARTTVLAMTEFGRTVRENGSAGTDHGTGGALLMAGGAIRGGRAYGDWPGLGEDQLYAGRDLMPTRDVRAYAAWAMRGLFGTGQDVLERSIFPGLDLGDDPGILG